VWDPSGTFVTDGIKMPKHSVSSGAEEFPGVQDRLSQDNWDELITLESPKGRWQRQAMGEKLNFSQSRCTESWKLRCLKTKGLSQHFQWSHTSSDFSAHFFLSRQSALCTPHQPMDTRVVPMGHCFHPDLSNTQRLARHNRGGKGGLPVGTVADTLLWVWAETQRSNSGCIELGGSWKPPGVEKPVKGQGRGWAHSQILTPSRWRGWTVRGAKEV
jgi:hypothetical protein